MNSRMAACGAFARMPMLSQVGRIVTLLLAATSIPCWAIGPSFDCDKVTTPLAHFICARSDLSRTDLEFVQSYYALRQQVGRRLQRQVLRDHRHVPAHEIFGRELQQGPDPER